VKTDGGATVRFAFVTMMASIALTQDRKQSTVAAPIGAFLTHEIARGALDIAVEGNERPYHPPGGSFKCFLNRLGFGLANQCVSRF